MRQELRIAGFGGQGVISMGILIAVAVGKYEGKPVAQTQSYGPEARGGACKTEVVISDTEIDYIEALQPDVLIAMSQPALDKYITDVDHEKCIIIIDDSLVDLVPESLKNVYRIPATRIAEEKFGTGVVANVVMFGAFAQLSGMVLTDSCMKSLKDNMQPKFLDMNYNAFNAGYHCAEQLH